MVTLKQLQRNLSKERSKVAKKQQIEERITNDIRAKRKAQSELFALKHRKAISRGKKAKALSKRFGRGLLRTGAKVGKKVGPAILKQAKLIREQQLRDDALERARLKPKSQVKAKTKRKTRRKSSKKKKR